MQSSSPPTATIVECIDIQIRVLYKSPIALLCLRNPPFTHLRKLRHQVNSKASKSCLIYTSSLFLSLDLSSLLSLSLALLLGDIQILGTGDFRSRSRDDDLDVTGVTLVRVDSTVSSVCSSSGFLYEIKGISMRYCGLDPLCDAIAA